MHIDLSKFLAVAALMSQGLSTAGCVIIDNTGTDTAISASGTSDGSSSTGTTGTTDDGTGSTAGTESGTSSTTDTPTTGEPTTGAPTTGTTDTSGTTGGDLFTCILACSPGFIVPSTTRGKPRVFISHGTKDQILPIDATSRRILPDLQRAGYVVQYREFDGPHTVPPAIAQEALKFI